MKRHLIEKMLWKWRDDPDRLPIILRGARQVGKSYTIECFGKEAFEQLVTVNFEFNRRAEVAFEDLDPTEIILKLERYTNARIIPGKTLLFLDEIQECPRAILALRYFKEKMPELHVIAAGSLLEFVLQEAEFSFPVGRIQFMYIKPFSFEEFLQNAGHHILLEYIESINLTSPFDESLHQQLLDLVRQYLFVGGMPAVQERFFSQKSYLECQQRQNALLQTYYNDFGKYASKTQHKYLQILFEKSPALVGKQFKYADVDGNFRARDLKIALEQLSFAGLLNIIYASAASGIPLKSQKKEDKFKLLFIDVGLLQCAMHMDYEESYRNNVLQINSGSIAEQFVGQSLFALGDPFQNKDIFFWKRDKKNSEAELDYIFQLGPHIIPIEVKAGKTGRLKSLFQFMNEKNSKIGVRISTLPLAIEDRILSLPFYLVGQLPRLLHLSLKQV